MPADCQPRSMAILCGTSQSSSTWN
jgi:hypothetical protein